MRLRRTKKLNTQDGYYYATGKVLVSKTHWHKVVRVQKQIQRSLEAYYLEGQTKMNIDNDVAGHVFGWVSCAKNILQRIRGEQ